MRGLLYGLLALLIWVSPAQAGPPGHSGGFGAFSPLSQQQLYTKRMRFRRGEPMISIGIMEHQARVTLKADSPVRVMFDEGSLPKTLYAPPATQFAFRALSSKPAQLRYWIVVQSTPYLALEQARATEKLWAARGYEVRSFEVGTIVALKGNVLDTRSRHVAVGGYKRRKRADRETNRIFKQFNLRTFLQEELLAAPRGIIGVYDESGRLIHKASDSVYFGTLQGGRVRVQDVEHGRGYKSHGRHTREFHGHIYVALDRSGKLSVINSVGAEALLGGLVPAEIFATAPLAALKAQAVTARGEIFSKLGHRHFGEPFHLCSEQHCQVYAGAGHERASTNQAVAETRGLLAVRPRADKKKAGLTLVDSVYSSTCGGFSEANEAVWDREASESLRPKIDGIGDDPALSAYAAGLNDKNLRGFLEAYPPVACARSSFVNKKKFRWRRKVSAAKLAKIGKKLEVGTIRKVEILGRGPGGRITGLRVKGRRGTKDVLRELPVRRLFGNLNSGLFVLDEDRDSKGALKSLTFVGGGWGHGVGMCQVGAIGRAERGHTFRQILAHYYNDAVVERIY